MQTSHLRALAGLAGVAMLAGCSVNPSAAATIDGTVITEKQVDQFIEDAAFPVGNYRLQALSTLLQIEGVAAPILREHADELDDAAREEAYAQCQIGPEITADSPETLRTWCEFLYLDDANPEVSAEFEELAESSVIEASPRYGDIKQATNGLSIPEYLTAQERE